MLEPVSTRLWRTMKCFSGNLLIHISNSMNNIPKPSTSSKTSQKYPSSPATWSTNNWKTGKKSKTSKLSWTPSKKTSKSTRPTIRMSSSMASSSKRRRKSPNSKPIFISRRDDSGPSSITIIRQSKNYWKKIKRISATSAIVEASNSSTRRKCGKKGLSGWRSHRSMGPKWTLPKWTKKAKKKSKAKKNTSKWRNKRTCWSTGMPSSWRRLKRWRTNIKWPTKWF